ncbi:MAG: SpoIIE family protein phosphatase [Bacteroidetes bacterium]|nr:SpoIIE family protein phosphatase [Bacteroidota bacterium]
MKRKVLSFFLLTLLLSPFPWGRVGDGLFAQTLNLNQFGIEEGLPQSSIYTMLQDKNGSIWVGTMSGVSKYNGLSFENFNKKDGLAENRVTSSCLDKDGNIWFGHWSGGISKYDAAKKHFEEITPGKIESKKTINCIMQDKSGRVWIGTDGQGIIKSENGNFTNITAKDGLAGDIVNALMEDKDGTIWIGTSTGITQSKSGKLSAYEETLPSNSIHSLFNDSKGNIWIGSTDKGVFRIGSDKQMKVYNASNGLSNENVRIIFEDANGTIFLGTYGGGVSKYLPQLEVNGYKGPVFQTISSKQGLSNDRVLSIIQDREKNIWIGTYLNLNQYFDEQFEIYGSNEGLDNSLVWSVIQDKKGNFWIGTEGGLIQSPSPALPEGKGEKDATGMHFNKLTGKEGEILNTSALYEDVKGNIWYTDFGKGLSRYNPSSKKIDNYTVEKSGLPVNEIYSICGDKDGNIWIGTNKGGLLKFDIATEKFQQFTTKDGIGSEQIYTIFRDTKDRMWFGTLAGSLTMYDGSAPLSSGGGVGGEVFKTFTDKEGYPSKFTLCITEDANKNIWFGTFDLGIYKYDGNTFKAYTTKEGLSSNTPFLLTTDNKNNLWIGTGLGVDRFNLKDETFKHYEKEDGFLGVEINPNAVCKDKEGALWFGSIIGLVKYNSNNEKNNEVEPITTIKNPRLFFQEADIPADHVFGWSQNHFTFDFIGTSLTNPKRVKYRYQLEGLDKEKSPIVKENHVTYPSLNPGSYTFNVWSCNNDGVWNTEPVTFQFSITPPFWKTTWFWVSSGIAGLLIIILFVKWREKKLKKENIILEKKVEERTITISKQNVELEKKNVKITDSIDYAKRIQDAVFISEQEMSKFPFEWFLLFKPKDIVSGDFYWSYERGNKIWIAAADCTGHGVPGAFMSLIGYNLLNHTVKEMGLFKPSDILNELRRMMQETFSGGSNGSSVKDGLAIAMVCIDKKERAMEYAGSYNALYLVRNNKLEEYKADRIPIGHSEHTSEEGLFTNHKIETQQGDSIYLFSDGYPDQPGGPNKKKFFYGPFKEMLVGLNTLPLQEQKKKLDDTITDWMQEKEQVDDITIFGIRF